MITHSKQTTMKTRRFLLLFVAILTLVGGNVLAQDFNKGLLYYNDNNTVLAKKYLLRELNGANKDQAYYLLGKVYERSAMSDSAKYYFQKGIEVNPENAFAYVGLGEVTLAAGDKKQAEGFFKKAKGISKEKKNPALWVAIYSAYINQKNPDVETANEFLSKAKDINKTFPGIYIAEGDYLMQQSKIGEAATKYENALYYDANSKEALLKLGRIYVKSGNYNSSLESFDKLYKLDSTYFPVHKERGEVYYAQGKYQDAAKSFAKFFAAAEPSYNDLVRYAFILFFNKDYATSLTILKQAQVINPNNMIANRVLAYNMYQTEDYANGVKAMEQFLSKSQPEDIIPSDYEYYGRLLSKVGNDSLAAVYFEKAITPKNRTAMYREIQTSYENLKKYDKVAEVFQVLYGDKPSVGAQVYLDWAKAHYYAGTAQQGLDSLTKTRHLQEADSLYGALVSKVPDYYIGYIWRARINGLFDLDGTKGLSKPYYEKVVELLEPKGERKKELVEAYMYLAYQSYLAKDKENSKNLFNKVLTLDPTNEKAKTALDGLK